MCINFGPIERRQVFMNIKSATEIKLCETTYEAADDALVEVDVVFVAVHEGFDDALRNLKNVF